MKTVIYLFAIVLYCQAANAQAGISLDVTGGSNTNGYGQVRFTNASALGDKTVESVNDDDIDGSPYFDNKWSKAIILLQNSEGVKVDKFRLDLYRNEVHYIGVADVEMVALSSVVKQVYVFDKKDTAKVAAVFQQIAGVDGTNTTAFVQVLNEGATELLKYTQVTLFNKGFDPIAGKNNYGFVTKPIYCLLKGGVVNTLKSLDEKAVVAVIKPSAQDTAWLTANNNKLRNEKDIIGFLNYYNGAK